MDPESRQKFSLLAPGVSGYNSIVLPGSSSSRLGLDEVAVEPGSREELIDGQVVEAMPSLPPHGDVHLRLDYVIGSSVAPDYVGSSDMLTRTSEGWNFAADVSVRKRGKDPATGERHLEELAFEIKYKQSMSQLTRRAHELSNRGVRRIFVLCVRADDDEGENVQVGPLLEWAPGEHEPDGRWVEVPDDGVIEDACLQRPISVRSLLDAQAADDEVVRNLRARGNPVLRTLERSFRQLGKQEGKQEALLVGIRDMCELLGLDITAERQRQLDRMSASDLSALRAHLKQHRRWL